MSVTKAEKTEIIADNAQSTGDTGSVEVQVAVLTQRIANLTEHLRSNKKDNSTRRGLIGMVSKRSKLMKYLKGQDMTRYRALVNKLGIRG